MALADILYKVIGYGLIVMAAITVWAVLTPGQALYIG